MIGFDAVAAQAVAEDLDEATTWDVATDRDGDRWRVLVSAPHTGEILRVFNTQADVDAWVKAGGHVQPRAGQTRPILNRYAIWFAPGMHFQVAAPTRHAALARAQARLERMHGSTTGLEIAGVSVIYECYVLDEWPERLLPLEQVELIEIDTAETTSDA